MNSLPDHLGGQQRGNVDRGVMLALQRDLGARSLVDIGCGDGRATETYAGLGYDVVGIDGDWTRLPQDPRYICHDFTTGPLPYELATRDVAYSVEFLEHLEERYLPHVAPVFRSCRYVVATAAPPGQQGHHHVNCRPRDYWVEVFDGWGFDFEPLYLKALQGQSTFCKASGPREGKPAKFFRNNGLFFRNREAA